MIQYENMSTWSVIGTVTGSVFPRSAGVGLISFSVGLGLAILRVTNNMSLVRDNVPESVNETFEKPFIILIYASTLGYLLVMRTNMALERWMSAMSEIEVMLSRWIDAFNALNSFFAGKNSSNSSPREMQRIQYFRIRIAHWFSLMSCLAFATLRARDLRSLHDVPILPKYPPNSSLRTFESSFVASLAHSSSGDVGPVVKHASTGISNDPRVALHDTGRDDFMVLHAPSPEEVRLLEPSSDKVNTLCLWIIQAIMVEVRDKVLDAPTPIVTRVFQELSDGLLGFNQAHKVAMVPFPFPFSQMVAVLLIGLIVTFPFFIDMFTKNPIFTPLISFVVPTCYHCINRLSIELEDPFGYSFNEIDIEIMNIRFNTLLEDTLWGPLEPPVSDNHALERAVSEGISAEYRSPNSRDSARSLRYRGSSTDPSPSSHGSANIAGARSSVGTDDSSPSMRCQDRGEKKTSIQVFGVQFAE